MFCSSRSKYSTTDYTTYKYYKTTYVVLVYQISIDLVDEVFAFFVFSFIFNDLLDCFQA